MLLKELVGEEKSEMILASNVFNKHGSDMTIWKPNRDGSFFIMLAWETIQVRGKSHGWMKWICHKLIPKIISLCMWKVTFHHLVVDDRIRRFGISMESTCNCCDQWHEENFDHIFSTSS